MKGIQKLYEISCIIEDVDPEELLILALDSGSPKVNIFGGNGKGIKALHELIIEFWDRVAVGGFGKRQANLKLFAEHLNSIDKIGEMEQAGRVSKVEAASLKRALVRAIGDVSSAGAITADQESDLTHGIQYIMHGQQKLLSPPIPFDMSKVASDFEEELGEVASSEFDSDGEEQEIADLEARLLEIKNRAPNANKEKKGPRRRRTS